MKVLDFFSFKIEYSKKYIIYRACITQNTIKTTIVRLKGIKSNTGSSCNSLKFKQIGICLRRDLSVGFLTFTQTGSKTTWELKRWQTFSTARHLQNELSSHDVLRWQTEQITAYFFFEASHHWNRQTLKNKICQHVLVEWCLS